ncbi:DnaJ family domain-containing protein [Bacillus andreraoultii]|uniref:DnaJ family domain-containing protein n=1 Tax=Bacillus andreraoultii TaxID=1499685 RepID=UPI00053AA5AC|nr:DUF1992 domain-containing protein [Bacillus andreraoultii]
MDLFWQIAEEKIKQAYRDGEFENLKGYGKPLKLKDDSGIPEDLRMAYRILESAGYTEEESQLKKEIMTLEDLMKNCVNDEKRKEFMQDLSKKVLQYHSLLAKKRIRTNSSIFKNYQEKIEERLLK